MENGYGIFYLRDKDNHPKGAVGIRYLPDGKSELTFCVCSIVNTYIKSRSRNIVFGRFKKNKVYTVYNPDHFDLKDALNGYRTRKDGKSLGLLKRAKRQGIDIPRMEYILKKILIGNKDGKNGKS